MSDVDLMTEEDAKTKWCPLVRQLGTLRQPALPGGTDYVVAAGSQNRGYAMGGPLDNCRCIASACMAWRTGIWDHQRNLEPKDRTPGVGYCGAFGKPK